MPNRLYIHITDKEKTSKIINDGILCGTQMEKGGTRNGNQFFGNFNGFTKPIKAFLYDALKAKESQRQRNLPRVGNTDHTKIMFYGFKMGIIPYFVHRFQVELYDALVFEADIPSNSMIENYAKIDGFDSKIYLETATSIPVEMKNLEVVDIAEVCEEIWNMKAPYITYKFPESGDKYWNRKQMLDGDPQTFIKPR